MGWGRKKTLRLFAIILVLSLIFMIASIVLIAIHLNQDGLLNSFMYLIGSVFITGLGCVWYRIRKQRSTFIHAILHTVALVLMAAGHRKSVIMIIDGKVEESFEAYSISSFILILYILQYILSFCLTLIGGHPSAVAFRSGIHAFFGALLFFICVTDGLCVTARLEIEQQIRDKLLMGLGCVFLLIYGLLTFYLLLNAYFDWRRMARAIKSEKLRKLRRSNRR